MAVRMLQRRGTSSQWTSANPVLGEGEIGWESDTNKFKIGDGVNTWANLSYFLDEDSIGGSLDGYATEAYVDTAISNLVDSAPAALDTLNELAASLGDDSNFATTVTNSLSQKAPLTQPIEAKTGAYTLQATDKGDMVTCSGTFTITVPGNIFIAGDRVDFINIGTGTITFSGSSLTLNAADAKFTINKQWAGATVFFTSATTAVLIGNLA